MQGGVPGGHEPEEGGEEQHRLPAGVTPHGQIRPCAALQF